MKPVLVAALWIAVSIPVAVLVAAVIRAASSVDLSEQVERYLWTLSSGRRRLSRRRRVRIGAAIALLSLAAVGSFEMVAGVPARIVTAGIQHRHRFGPPPTPDTELASDDIDAEGTTGPAPLVALPSPGPVLPPAIDTASAPLAGAGLRMRPDHLDDQPVGRPSPWASPAPDGEGAWGTSGPVMTEPVAEPIPERRDTVTTRRPARPSGRTRRPAPS